VGMLSKGQVWKNGCKIAQINIEDEIFKAVIFSINKEKLIFSNIIDVDNEQLLLKMGFKPTEHVLVAKEK
jgi:hypothetical protein